MQRVWNRNGVHWGSGVITITREKKFNRQGWHWMYSLVGPDGYHSTDKNLQMLRQMAEKRYPGHDITETWKETA